MSKDDDTLDEATREVLRLAIQGMNLALERVWRRGLDAEICVYSEGLYVDGSVRRKTIKVDVSRPAPVETIG